MYRSFVLSALLSTSLVGCILTTSGGGYPATGKVLDKSNGLPLEDVKIRLKYLANSPYGPHSKFSSTVLSDAEGEFHVPAEEVQLWGGSGGLAGRINEWPTVELSKDNYCTQSVSFGEPSVEKYQEMRLELEPNTGDNCTA